MTPYFARTTQQLARKAWGEMQHNVAAYILQLL